MKDKIFISHATPEDNYFAAWLASKLNVLGYNAWVDVEDFNTGDAFFTKIQPLIKDQSIRFIAVNSKAYITKSKDQNTGVSRELNTAISVSGIDNFILPIRLDDISYSDFPAHYINWNAIDFNNNWQNGFIELVKQLEKLNVPKNDVVNPIDLWFKTIKNENKVIEKEERCYSNWFAFKLPEYVYILTPTNISKEIYDLIPYPIIMESNRIITFASNDTVSNTVEISSFQKIGIQEFLNNSILNVDSSLNIIDPQKKIVRLLNNCMKIHLSKCGLSYWRKRDISYFNRTEGMGKAISLKKRYGKSSRALVGEKTMRIRGKVRSVNWHYAISPRVELHPFPHYRFYYTLIFTNEQGRGLDTEISRTLRRSAPADWYNRKWFEMLLASAINISSSDTDEHIKIEIDSQFYLQIENLPVGGSINVGYVEPNGI